MNGELEVLYNSKSLCEAGMKLFGKKHGTARENVKKICERYNFDWKKEYKRRKNKINKTCLNCNIDFLTYDKASKFCSHSCSASYSNIGRIMSNQTKAKISNKMKIDTKIIENIKNLYKDGCSINKIKNILHVSTSTIQKYIYMIE